MKSLFIVLCLIAVGVSARQKPNVVLILADDLGYGSTGCCGADPNLVRTPLVGRLAERMQKEIDRQQTQGFSRPGAAPYLLKEK